MMELMVGLIAILLVMLAIGVAMLRKRQRREARIEHKNERIDLFGGDRD